MAVWRGPSPVRRVSCNTGEIPSMASHTFFSRSKYGRAGSFMDRLLYVFSVFIVPALITAGTLATLLWAPHQFESQGSVALPRRVFTDTRSALAPASALSALRERTPAVRYSTRLAETPVWFLFTVPSMSANQGTYAELPSRHA